MFRKDKFGGNIIDDVKALYNDICIHVSNCGCISESFMLSRGICQGGPISTNLFVIIVEVMASAIRQNPRILGIQVGQRESRILQYADDMCIYVSNSDSFQIVLR